MIERKAFSAQWLQFATGEQCRAERDGVRVVAGEANRGGCAKARKCVLERDATSGLEQERAGAGRVAPDDDLLRIEGVDRRWYSDADPLTPALHHAPRGL